MNCAIKVHRTYQGLIKIAILDTGIDLSDNHKEQFDYYPKFTYRNFIEDQPLEWKDEHGIGTHLAVLLRKIAPRAAIHVARVYEKKPDAAESERK